jgi:hypothetical protein
MTKSKVRSDGKDMQQTREDERCKENFNQIIGRETTGSPSCKKAGY